MGSASSFRGITSGRRACAAALAACLSLGAVVEARADDAAAARHVETWRTERASAARKGRLVIRVSGLEPGVGALLVALYDKTTPFLSFDHQLDRKRVGVSAAVTEAVFADVPYGNYAVAVIYDRNNNGRLDMRLGVLPTEPLGFSGGAKVGTFGPPGYRAAAFDLTAPEKIVAIAVR